MVLDEFSLKLGSIEEGLRNVGKLYAVIDNKLDRVLDSTAVINEKANKAHARIDDIMDPNDGLLTIAAANAAEAQETLKKGKWVLMGVGGSGLLGGTVMGSWLTKIGAFVTGGTGP